MTSSFTIGVDVGGTFTDLALLESGRHDVRIVKTPTTPAAPIEGVWRAIELAAETAQVTVQELLSRTTKLVHGTTLTTNVLFNRDGARVGFLTTRGFGDQVLIMRAKGRVAGLSLAERRHFRRTDKPVPLVDYPLIVEIAERIDWKGAVLVPLDEADARRALADLRREGAEAFAVCLLWSFRNPVHERRLAELVRAEFPGAFISVSSELSPVVGEYERGITTVVNAYVGPPVASYMQRLRDDLTARGLTCPPLILQSHGGAAHVDEVVPVQTVESGPAAGIVGARYLGDLLGVRHIVAADVGGTTFKVGLIRDGEWSYASETVIGQFELQIPMVDVISIGAGGGSVAWADGSRLRVGPRSVGAEPGPACYARGGAEPTVTDADLVLGYLNPGYFLGGRIPLLPERAEAAIREHVGGLFDGDIVRAAHGIRRVTDAQMADLIRKATIERGWDLRDFVLMAYGGMGPVHCCDYAAEAGIDHIVVPYAATVHSALAAAVAEVRMSRKLSAPLRLPGDPAHAASAFARLEADAMATMARQGIAATQVAIGRWAEMRYRRQMHVVRVPVSSGDMTAAALARTAETFEARYASLYGASANYREAGIEIVTFGVDATAKTPQPELMPLAMEGEDVVHAHKGERDVVWSLEDGPIRTAVLDGERLRPGNRFRGAAIVEYVGTTLVVSRGWSAHVDRYRNVHLERADAPVERSEP
jgi:N-methylhydantoinase A